MGKTKIEWTGETWNPTTGCTKVSSGCINCYAEKMSYRLQKMGNLKYSNGFEVAIHPSTLAEPYKWKTSKTVFVNSMSDLFHEKIPLDFIKAVFKVMNDNSQHTFQILTKRSDVLERYSESLNWTKNIWMGVTVEDIDQLFRIENLRRTNAHIKFLSCEPLLSDLGIIDLDEIDWVIVGGESGSNSRPMQEQWVQNILNQCNAQKVAFFFKQWGGFNKKKNGRVLNGRTYSDMPLLK